MKLITWNVQWFCGLDDRVDVERVVAHARSMADFDVLCLQEVAVNYPQLTGDAGFDQVARLRELLPEYEIVFGAGDYFRALGLNLPEPLFVDEVALRFGIANVDQHYHVPLLVSPWSYSTYRGS